MNNIKTGGMRESVFNSIFEYLCRKSLPQVPNHIALITDGNRRFATRRGISVHEGHDVGAKKVVKTVNWCRQIGISELTIYSFSTENFNRPNNEINNIFNIIKKYILVLDSKYGGHEESTSVSFIGDRSRLPKDLVDVMKHVETDSHSAGQFQVNVAVGYGGRHQLLSAIRDIVRGVAENSIEPSAIDSRTVREHLYSSNISEVDLVVRAGGEKRTSNFFPWLAVGSEAYFDCQDVLWPKFSRINLFRSLYRWNRNA